MLVKSRGGKFLKKLRCCVSDKASSFEQEKLFALNEEDFWHFLSITSLVLSPFEAVTGINIST